MDQNNSVAEFVPARTASAAAMLGTAMGEEAALRVVQGKATLCDVVLAAWSMEVDPVEAVLQYAEAAAGIADVDASERCA
ncbi:hypothetical protein [Nocardia sp. NPDC052566]|uniref:hypothetical protein n=1 Tax=Nocardia sp. NPDC052566 TaxID=3364330 RepID=UPI0037C9A617